MQTSGATFLFKDDSPEKKIMKKIYLPDPSPFRSHQLCRSPRVIAHLV